MTDTRDLHDDDLGAVVRAAGAPAGVDFRADLRARLAAAIDGDVELDPVEPADHRRTWLPIVAVAAVVALVIGTIAVIARERDPELGQATDLATQLVGPTWVALDVGVAGRLPSLQMKLDPTRPDVIVMTTDDGCMTLPGEFSLEGTTVVGGNPVPGIACTGSQTVAMPQQGASLSVDGDVLTVSSTIGTSVFTALESLDPVEGDQLDGLWAAGPARIRIVDGEVTGTGAEPVTDIPDGDTFPAEFADALTAGIAEAWAYGESLIVRTPTTGLRRLDPAGPATSTDLAAQLVGRTWVVMDGVPPGDLPTLVMKIGTTRPDVIIVNGDDGCNTHSGEFRLDGTTVVDAEIVQTQMGCVGGDAATMPAEGASLSIDGDILTVSEGQDASSYRALQSLPTASVDALDGSWNDGNVQFAIADGRVVEPVPDGIATEIDRALATGTLAAWAWNDVLIVQTSTTGFRLLEPVAGTGSANLLDELVGRTWVGIGGDWQTAAPTLVFDSLNREPGLSAISVFDGCNSGEGTFVLDGATMVNSEIVETDLPCPHADAGLDDGTNLAVTDGLLAVTHTSGLTTFYVALDSLEPVPGTDLPAAFDGVWEFAGSVFTIDGDTVGSQGSTPTAVWELLSGTVNSPVVEAWRRDRDLVLRDGSTFVVLVRSDLPVGGSPVVTTGPLTGGDQALILGTVTLEDGCLVTTLEGIRYPLVWQPGTSWNGVDTVILPDGVNVPMGQAIEAGGGYYSADQLEGFGIDAAGIDTMRGCADRIGPEIAVVQSPVTLQFPGADGG